MADVTKFQLGGADGNELALGADSVRVYRHVIDIAKAKEEGYTPGSSYGIMAIPAGTIILALDAVIIEALVGTGTVSTDIGTTKADPDEYVDNQTTTAVGRFGAYVSVTRPEIITADSTLWAEINGTTLTSGKIAVTVVAVTPANTNRTLASYRSYPNA